VRRRAALLASLLVLLAGCGGGNGDDDVGDTGPPTGPAPTGTIDDTTETDD
jgi:hypothetical protein